MAAVVTPPAPLAANYGTFEQQFLVKALALHQAQTQDPRTFIDVFGRWFSLVWQFCSCVAWVFKLYFLKLFVSLPYLVNFSFTLVAFWGFLTIQCTHSLEFLLEPFYVRVFLGFFLCFVMHGLKWKSFNSFCTA
jgi:hypothetical protein